MICTINKLFVSLFITLRMGGISRFYAVIRCKDKHNNFMYTNF